MSRKKLFAIMSAATIMATTLIPTAAAANVRPEPTLPLLQQAVQEAATPRYKNISHITSYIEITDGVAEFSGSYSAYEDRSAVLTLTLQKSKNQATWSDVQSWSKSYSGSGYHGFGESKSVESGYYYRCKTNVSINGESINCNSYVEKA